METDDYDNIDEVSVNKYKSYEEFLDKFVTYEDRIYLEDEDLARDVKELYAVNKGIFLWYNSGDIKSKEDFEKKKKELASRDQQEEAKEKPPCSEGKVFEPGTFLWHLQTREYDVRNGRKSTIIFIRYREGNGKESSAYIDYRERLKTDNFEQIFNGDKDLIPRSSDLSYYNWTIQKVYSNDSTFFRVDAGPKERLSFRNNTDRKIINVDLEFLSKHQSVDVKRTSVDISRTELNIVDSKNKNNKKNKNEDAEKEYIGYQQIVIFDYETRSK
jgi:hypothetical protein